MLLDGLPRNLGIEPHRVEEIAGRKLQQGKRKKRNSQQEEDRVNKPPADVSHRGILGQPPQTDGFERGHRSEQRLCVGMLRARE